LIKIKYLDSNKKRSTETINRWLIIQFIKQLNFNNWNLIFIVIKTFALN